MKWYLVVKTDMGTLDLGTFGNYYATQESAEQDAVKARAIPFVLSVEVRGCENGRA